MRDDSLHRDVKYQYGRIWISDDSTIWLTGEPLTDWAIADALKPCDTWVELNQRNKKLNRMFGPRSEHGPTRADFDRIRRAHWLRVQNWANIARLGRPAGQFRRAPFCDGHRVPCPLGLSREFFDGERGSMHCVECPT